VTSTDNEAIERERERERWLVLWGSCMSMAHMSEFFCKFCAEAMASHAGNWGSVLPAAANVVCHAIL